MKTVNVYKFDSKNFKKNGGLKKTANPHIGMTIFDTDDTDTKYNNDAIAKSIKRAIPGIVSIESPYIFTHINIDTTDGRYIVFETVRIGGSDLITSPTNLLKALNSN